MDPGSLLLWLPLRISQLWCVCLCPRCWTQLVELIVLINVCCCNCLSDYVCRDKTVVNRYLLSVLVRLFLEKLEQSILKFVSDFSQLTVSDEKVNTCLVVLQDTAVITVSIMLCIM